MRATEIFLAVCLIIVFCAGLYAANDAGVKDAERANKIEKCVIKNKELAQPREYCRAAVNQGVE